MFRKPSEGSQRLRTIPEEKYKEHSQLSEMAKWQGWHFRFHYPRGRTLHDLRTWPESGYFIHSLQHVVITYSVTSAILVGLDTQQCGRSESLLSRSLRASWGRRTTHTQEKIPRRQSAETWMVRKTQRAFQRTASAKALRQDWAWYSLETGRRLVWHNELQTGRRQDRDRGKGDGTIIADDETENVDNFAYDFFPTKNKVSLSGYPAPHHSPPQHCIQPCSHCSGRMFPEQPNQQASHPHDYFSLKDSRFLFLCSCFERNC